MRFFSSQDFSLKRFNPRFFNPSCLLRRCSARRLYPYIIQVVLTVVLHELADAQRSPDPMNFSFRSNDPFTARCNLLKHRATIHEIRPREGDLWASVNPAYAILSTISTYHPFLRLKKPDKRTSTFPPRDRIVHGCLLDTKQRCARSSDYVKPRLRGCLLDIRFERFSFLFFSYSFNRTNLNIYYLHRIENFVRRDKFLSNFL